MAFSKKQILYGAIGIAALAVGVFAVVQITNNKNAESASTEAVESMPAVESKTEETVPEKNYADYADFEKGELKPMVITDGFEEIETAGPNSAPPIEKIETEIVDAQNSNSDSGNESSGGGSLTGTKDSTSPIYGIQNTENDLPIDFRDN